MNNTDYRKIMDSLIKTETRLEKIDKKLSSLLVQPIDDWDIWCPDCLKYKVHCLITSVQLQCPDCLSINGRRHPSNSANEDRV